jgi:hypothetical protein
MSPWVADLINKWGGVVLGWGLGLASTPVVEWRKKRKTVCSRKIAISREFREMALRLVFLIYAVERRQGRLNRELLEWMRPQIQRYGGVGPNPSKNFLAAVEGLLKRSDDELAQFAAYEKSNTPLHFFYPREEASYATEIVVQAHDFEPDYAERLLDILSHLRMLNEAREDGLYYHHLTFTPGMSAENHKAAIQNVSGAGEQIAFRARIIVDKITALEQKYSTGE